MLGFVTENWSAIMISTFFFLLSIPVMFWRARTIRRERRSKARELLIDAAERHLSQESGLSLGLLDELIRAAEREYEVPLLGWYDVQDLIRDLILRASKSAYLAPETLDAHTATLEMLLRDRRQAAVAVAKSPESGLEEPESAGLQVPSWLDLILEYQRPLDFAKVLVVIAFVASLFVASLVVVDAIHTYNEEQRERTRLEEDLVQLKERNDRLRSVIESLGVTVEDIPGQ